MNPVPVMALVEVIRGIATSDATARAIVELASSLGKTPVEVRDFPGFIANRILMPMINEAIFAVYEGVAIDRRDRHGHEARHEPSDGAAHAGRLHRPRHVSRDHERALRRLRRFEVPRMPAAQAVRRGGLARQEVGPRLLRLPRRRSRFRRVVVERRSNRPAISGRSARSPARSPRGRSRRTLRPGTANMRFRARSTRRSPKPASWGCWFRKRTAAAPRITLATR